MNELLSRARKDNSINLLVGDLGYGVVDNFAAELPRQFFNLGVAEQNMTGVAAGLAHQGRKVFTYSIANFPTFRALEQIRNDIVYHRLPVTIVSVGAGLAYGALGYSHHAVEDIAVMRAMPGMRVLSPADPFEAVACMMEIFENPMPTYLRIGKNGEPELYEKQVENLCNLVLKSGNSKDIILTTGSIAQNVLKALELISAEIRNNVDVISVPQIKPLNIPASKLKNARSLISVEEHTKIGGLGSAVLEWINEQKFEIPFLRLGLPDEIHNHVGSPDYLRDKLGLSPYELAAKFHGFYNDLNRD